MKRLGIVPGKLAVICRSFFIYVWLSVLAALSATDTYYSVYVLCAAGAFLCLMDNYKTGRIRTGKQKTVLYLFSGLFSASVLLGNYELFMPLSVLQNLFDGACCFAGGLFVGYEILLFMLDKAPWTVDPAERKRPWLIFLAVFFSVALIDLLYLKFALYPGVLTTDSFSTLKQLLGHSRYNNTMPFWHTVTVKVFVDLGMAIFGELHAAVAFFHSVQILFMAACFGYAIVTMYQRGIPGWFLAAVYCIYAFQPHNIVYSVTLWKDIPFAAAGLLFITALYRLLKGIGKFQWLNYVIFTVGALGFSLWRTNGWYAFLATVVIMLCILKQQKKTILILMCVVLIFCWILINPVLDCLGVSETNLVEAFAVPMQQIARVVSEGRDLSEEEYDLLSEIFWMDKLERMYDPQTVDPVKFETFQYDKVDYIKENASAYLKLYFRIGLRYPGDYLKAWIEETRGYWNGGYFFWIYTRSMDENSLGLELTLGDNLIARLYAAAFRYLEKPVMLQPLVSIGLHVWALIACTLINAMKKREDFLLAIPLLVLVFGLWIGTPVYSEFRYAYPVFLGMPLILGTTLFEEAC